MLDNSDFQETDIPFEVPLPDHKHVPVIIDYLFVFQSYGKEVRRKVNVKTFLTGSPTRRSKRMGTSCLYGPTCCPGVAFGRERYV